MALRGLKTLKVRNTDRFSSPDASKYSKELYLMNYLIIIKYDKLINNF
jgi:hypothetical protein